MKKIISIRITDQEERRIEKIKEWYKNNIPFALEYTTTDILKLAINVLYYETIQSNNMD